MGTINDLNKLIQLLHEFELPVSPILEYAIKEKMESLSKEVEIHEYTINATTPNVASHSNSPTTLRVVFPDGTIISEIYAADTLRVTINRIGPDIIESLCSSESALHHCHDLVSKVKVVDERYKPNCWRQLNNGYYLFTNTNTEVKKRQLECISKALSLNLKIDVIKRSSLVYESD